MLIKFSTSVSSILMFIPLIYPAVTISNLFELVLNNSPQVGLKIVPLSWLNHLKCNNLMFLYAKKYSDRDFCGNSHKQKMRMLASFVQNCSVLELPLRYFSLMLCSLHRHLIKLHLDKIVKARTTARISMQSSKRPDVREKKEIKSCDVLC